LNLPRNLIERRWAGALLAAILAAAPLAAQEAAPPAPAPAERGDATPAEGKKDAERDDERVRFEVELADGRAVIRAEDFRYQPGDYMIATAGVEVRYKDLVLTADRARLDIPTQLITAEGNVVLDEGPRRLSGDTLEYHLESRTGRLTNATAYVQPDYYFSGVELAKTGPEDYAVTDGVFTSCSGDSPPWSIALSSAKVTLEDYARIKNARMRFKNVPVLYVPYILWPTKTERSSGFLIPKPGFSSRRGAYLGVAYYQTLGRSADLTLLGDAYSESYFGGGMELRWRPSETSRGLFQGYFITEPDEIDPADVPPVRIDPNFMQGDDRWKLRFFHQQDKIFKHFRAVIDFVDYSDFNFQGDYERDVSRSAQSFVYSNAYLTANVGNQSFNILVDRRERVRRGGRDVRHQLPEIEYRLRPTRLGSTPIYFSLLSSLNYFQVQLDEDEFDYGRADLLPFFSIPLSTIPWLSAKLDVGGRVTFYSDSLNDRRSEFSGESLTRTFGSATLEVVGPAFSRIFNKGLGRFAKIKHVIEPRFDFNFVSDFDDQLFVPVFDEVDNFLSRQDVVFSFNHRLIAKPAADEEDDPSAGGAFEIASFSLAQGYSFDDDRPLQFGRRDRDRKSQASPIFASLRLNPSQRTSLKLDAAYNTLFGRFESASLSGRLALGKHNELGAAWFTRFNAETGAEQRNQAQLFGSFALLPERLFLDGAFRFDLRLEETLEQILRLRYNGSCYGLQLEWRESNFANVDQSDVRFLLTLKHVGTFLDFTSSTGSF